MEMPLKGVSADPHKSQGVSTESSAGVKKETSHGYCVLMFNDENLVMNSLCK